MIVIVDAVISILGIKMGWEVRSGGEVRCSTKWSLLSSARLRSVCKGGATFTSLSDDAAVSFSETVSKPRAELVHKTSTCTRTKHTDIRFYSKERLA